MLAAVDVEDVGMVELLEELEVVVLELLLLDELLDALVLVVDDDEEDDELLVGLVGIMTMGPIVSDMTISPVRNQKSFCLMSSRYRVK